MVFCFQYTCDIFDISKKESWVIAAILLVLTISLAYANGANDNFKGVATLFGSGALSYRSALILATAMTVLGSICSVFFARTLIDHFSGKGFVPDAVAHTALFPIAIASAVFGTIILATLTGFPISTTHAVTGALIGAGFAAVGARVHFSQLGKPFLFPLLASPIIAIILGMISYNLFRLFGYGAKALRKGWCICVSKKKAVAADDICFNQALIQTDVDALVIDRTEQCEASGFQRIAVADKRSFLNFLHCLSGGAVCFARAMNDTPKIAALMLVAVPFSTSASIIVIACGMAVGGILSSRKVAMTLSKRIIAMNETEGLAANLVTSLLVIFSSKLGLPVSTTHVAVGSLVGVGSASKKVRYGVFGKILLCWILTLPIAALLGGCFYWILLQIARH